MCIAYWLLSGFSTRVIRMGTFSVKVRILVGALLLPFCTAILCPVGQQYWSTKSESCVNCSKCDTQSSQIVIRPCQGHLDTVCGPISDLDWSWLTNKKDDKKQKNHHGTHHNKDLHHLDHLEDTDIIHDDAEDIHEIVGNSDDDVMFVSKKHGKKYHKHHDSKFDDILGKVDKHNNKKHHGHVTSKILDDKDLSSNDKKHHKIHLTSESFVFDDIGSEHHSKNNKHHNKNYDSIDDNSNDDDSDIFDDIERFKHYEKADELEKEWRRWLAESENRLQHRKNDLIKNLREEGKNKKSKEHNKKENHHMNVDIYNGNDDVTNKKNFDDLNSDISEKESHSPHRYISKQDLKVFTDFVSEEYKKRKDTGKNNGDKHDKLSHMKHFTPNDFVFPVDSFDYRSVVPTHRLFLGEPSTVSEMLDQDFLDTEKLLEDGETEAKGPSKFKVIPWEEDSGLEEKEPSVIAVPFTAAEKFVWDWQAVALTSAVAACLLFFAVVAVYSILHARQWKRLKSNLDTDVEELSARISLMQAPNLASSAADGSNANHYLENLLAGMKSSDKPPTSNIYIQKHSVG